MGNTCGTKPKAIIGSQHNVDQAASPAELANYSNGKLYEDMGHFSQAIEFYNQATSVNPTSVMAHNGLGNCYLKQGDYARAINSYDKVLVTDPNNKFAYNGLGVAYEGVGKEEKAIQCFNKAIQLDSNFAYPYNGLGNMYYIRKKYNEALPHYENAVRLNPSNALALANLATCQAALGRTELASETSRRAQNAAASDTTSRSASNQHYLSEKLKEFNSFMSSSGQTVNNQVTTITQTTQKVVQAL